MIENNNLVINSAKGFAHVVNIGSSDLIEGREHLILGLIWQIIRRGLLSKIDIKLHPELYRLLEEDETLEQFLRLPPEQILLRWFNYHLKAANWHRRVANFSKDVQDGENYTVLLNQLDSAKCSRAPLQTRDLLQRAEQVISNSTTIDFLGSAKCRQVGLPKVSHSRILGRRKSQIESRLRRQSFQHPSRLRPSRRNREARNRRL